MFMFLIEAAHKTANQSTDSKQKRRLTRNEQVILSDW